MRQLHEWLELSWELILELYCAYWFHSPKLSLRLGFLLPE